MPTTDCLFANAWETNISIARFSLLRHPSEKSSILQQLGLKLVSKDVKEGTDQEEWQGKATYNMGKRGLSEFSCTINGSFLKDTPHGECLLTVSRNGPFSYQFEFSLRARFVYGFAIGPGATFQAPGVYYLGDWSGIYANGRGSAIVSHSYTLAGNWERGCLHIQGRISSREFTYFGGMLHGKRHGQGLCWEDGRRVYGCWVEDKMVSTESVALPDDTKWVGALDENNKPTGEGVFHLSSGLIYIGTMTGGEMDGHGLICDKAFTFARYVFHENGVVKGPQLVTTPTGQTWRLMPHRDGPDYLPIAKIDYVSVAELIQFVVTDLDLKTLPIL